MVCCCHIMTFLMENVRPIGKVVVFVWQLVKFNLEHSHSKILKIVTLQMFCIALFNGPVETVMLASKDNMWDKLVSNLKKYHGLCEEDFERQRLIIGKRSITVGLCSFMVVQDRPTNAQIHL